MTYRPGQGGYVDAGADEGATADLGQYYIIGAHTNVLHAVGTPPPKGTTCGRCEHLLDEHQWVYVHDEQARLDMYDDNIRRNYCGVYNPTFGNVMKLVWLSPHERCDIDFMEIISS